MTPVSWYESRDKWTQIGCLHTILCLWVPLKHEEAAIFHRKMSEFRMFSVILGVHKHGKITDDSFKIHLSGNSYNLSTLCRNSSAQDFALAAKSVNGRSGRGESNPSSRTNLKWAGFCNSSAFRLNRYLSPTSMIRQTLFALYDTQIASHFMQA